MGSYAYLGVGRLEIDWGKNYGYPQHADLYLPSDLAEADYFYADGVVERKPAYVRRLGDMLRRLDLLGYGASQLELRFDELVAQYPGWYDPPEFSFQDLADALGRVDVGAVRNPEEGDYDLGEFVRGMILEDPAFQRAAPRLSQVRGESLHYLESLEPKLLLALLAANPKNHSLDVEWRFHDVMSGGYVDEDEVYHPLGPFQQYLIVTEGSTDSSVLKAALPVVAPDVADFFDFVDMSENYPFTGTGNVVRFCEGLVRIGIHRRMLIVLDNDTAGREACMRIAGLPLPSNMNVTVLPEIEVCRAIRTMGPAGEATEDVNGRAGAIELYLDLSDPGLPPARVRWTNYVSHLDDYQGQLENKDEYTRHFFRATRGGPGDYDYTNLDTVWRHIIDVCATGDA